MTTAASVLVASRPSARIAFVLEIEGHDVVYTDVPDLTVWTGYTVRPGLQMRGSVTRSMDLLGFAIEPVGFGFEIVEAVPWDTTNSLAKLLAHLDESAILTELRTNADRDDTTLNVLRTTAFPSSGTIHIGHERITYTGKTQTGTGIGSFTGCTRGTLPTSASSAASPGTWAHTHKVGTEAGPEVANKHRVWKNRMVTIYVVGVDPDTGTWNARANALNELVGLIEDYGFRDGAWQFSCTSLEKRLESQLLRDQYQGTISGLRLASAAKIQITLHITGAAFTTGTVTIPSGQYTIDTLIAKFNDLARSLFSNHYVSCALRSGVVEFTLHAGTASEFFVQTKSLNTYGRLVHRMLGWNGTGPVIMARVAASGAFSVTAPGPPMVTYWNPNIQSSLSVAHDYGSWADQSADDLPGGTANGCVMIGDSPLVWLVSRSGDTLTWLNSVDLHGRAYRGEAGHADVESVEIARYLGDEPLITIKQIWMASSNVSRMLLRMLLSTGTANYNHATYDKWPDSMSAGFPANVVDVPSFEAIGEQLGGAGNLFQVLLKPESMASHIESMMQTFGFHIVWRNMGGTYKLVATVPTTIATMTPSYVLDASNTGNDHGTDCSSGAELVRNRLTLRYNRDPETGEFRARDIYDNLSAMSEQDEPSALEYDALALYDNDGSKLSAWRTNVAAPFCAYFARPIPKYKRSGARTLWFLSVGDVILLDDPDAPNASTGTYGFEAKCWVTSITKNYETYEVESIELLAPPVKAYRYAPSAMLDYSRGDKGYDNATRRLYLRAHEFSRATDSADVTKFEVGDRINIAQVNDVTFGVAWDRVVEAIGADYLQISVALSSPAFDNTERYYVNLSSYSLAKLNSTRIQGGSSSVAFKADAENIVADGGAGTAPFPWGSDLPLTDSGATPTGDEHFRRVELNTFPTTDALGVQALRDLAYAVNNLHRHVLNQHPISEQYPTARSTSSTSYVQAAGPFKVWCPQGAEALVFSLDVLVTGSGTATFRMTCSGRRPTGDSTTVLEFDNDVTQVEASTTSTTTVKVAGTVNVRPNQEGYTYVTIEMKHSSGGANTSQVRAVSAYFAARAVV